MTELIKQAMEIVHSDEQDVYSKDFHVENFEDIKEIVECISQQLQSGEKISSTNFIQLFRYVMDLDCYLELLHPELLDKDY